MPEGGAIQQIPVAAKKEDLTEKTLAQRMEAGKSVYQQNCAACHQLKGEGIPDAFPPLAKSDYLMKDKKRAIQVILQGLTGDIVVNGKKYNGVMPSLGLSDEDVANVTTFIRNSWGNKSEVTTLKEVKALRGK